MTILSRFSEILVAQMHALLDRVEDPEAMLAQVLRDLECDLAAARVQAARAIAAERQLSRELAQQHAEIEPWHNAAQRAIAAQRDDLARQALVRKHELTRATAELMSQHLAAMETSAQARSMLAGLEAELATARRVQRSLLARHRAAQARRDLHRAASKRHGPGATFDSKLRRWEQRIADLEEEIAAELEVQGIMAPDEAAARADTAAEIEHEFNALKDDSARSQ